MFILEIRASTSEGSINKGGHFQSNLVVVEASVKDEARFPGKWAYFDFGRDMKTQVAALADDRTLLRLPRGERRRRQHVRAVLSDAVSRWPRRWGP